MKDPIGKLKFKDLVIQENTDTELVYEEEAEDDFDYEVTLPRVSGWVGANGKSVRGVVVINHDKNINKNKKININMKMSKKDLIKDQQHICPICFDAWTSDGHHRICCLPCGHIYGLSCIRRWLQQKGQKSSQCPQCNESCTMKNVELLYATRLRDVVADHKISTTRFPFTRKGSRAFKLYTSIQQTDALKRRDDALKLLADVRGRHVDLLKRRDDILDSQADVLRQQDNALECQAEALEYQAEALGWRAEALEQRAKALGRRADAFKAREAGVVDCSELTSRIVELLVEGASCLTVVEEGEPVESALTRGITSTIGAIASRA
nr:zinc finger, RING/FYVE/PHD-type [Tanacetum cinerariifolium]